MKKLLITLVVLAGVTSISAEAFDWSSALNFINNASEPKTVETQITNLNDLEKQMSAIDSSVQTAFVEIVSKLSGWKETRNVKSQLKSGKTTLANVISNYANTYMENNRQSITNKIKKMSDKDRTVLTNNLKTLTECGQKYLTLAANGAKTATNTLKTAQNISEVANTVANINKAAVELRSRASNVYSLVKQVKSIATTAGVTIN